MDIGNSCAIRNGYEKANGYVNEVRKIFTHFKNTVHKAARSQLKVGDKQDLLFKEVQEVQASLEKVPDHFKLPLRRGHGTTEDVQAMEHNARKGPDKMKGNSLVQPGPNKFGCIHGGLLAFCQLSQTKPRAKLKAVRLLNRSVSSISTQHWGWNAAWVETKTQHTRKPLNGTQPMSKTNCVLKFGSEARSGTANRILGTQKCNVSVGQKPRMKKRVPPGSNTCLAHPTAPPSSQSPAEEEKRGKGGNEGKRRGKGMTEPRPGRGK
ncbi:hypothetical protein B0H17DRAFT_1153890 [Mycena rosella]|uniref:Uncharacterized protein n=1 Tax=Mycena rosella TaxID=1033263 RepID=A0AAD7B1G6_MYCRO|nr:hypothetical protein B0H17DRAFT_1153890 [Mycena rosella]